MSFKVNYLSNYHNSRFSFYNGTYIGDAWSNGDNESYYHNYNYIYDINGNGLFYDHSNMNRTRIFQFDGKENIYDRKNI